MSDLIRKQEVIDIMYEVFGKYSVANDKQDVLGGFGLEMFRRVKELPAAYDVEKVCEELEKWSSEVAVISEVNGKIHRVKVVNAGKAIDIAREGGVE